MDLDLTLQPQEERTFENWRDLIQTAIKSIFRGHPLLPDILQESEIAAVEAIIASRPLRRNFTYEQYFKYCKTSAINRARDYCKAKDNELLAIYDPTKHGPPITPKPITKQNLVVSARVTIGTLKSLDAIAEARNITRQELVQSYIQHGITADAAHFKELSKCS